MCKSFKKIVIVICIGVSAYAQEVSPLQKASLADGRLVLAGVDGVGAEQLASWVAMARDGGVVFELYTRKNPQLFEVITPNKDPKHFNPDAPTYVVVHGWTVRDYALYRIKDNYLRTGDVNVIMVDWTRYSVDLYPKSAASTKYVGERIGELLLSLISRHPSAGSSLRLVGHSLGAHVSGRAGRYLQERNHTVARITALDPAGPLFEVPPLLPGLTPSDASFVLAVHTDGGAFGLVRPRGHADFYANGGGPVQPGCGGYDLIGTSCSHFRSSYYFAESILHGGFTAVRCGSLADFLTERCRGGDRQRMGDRTSDRARGMYYLRTNILPPYSRG
ncbi:unnamed protein product [Plutella xylostella]|uniref:(diamondback moth) hypothetical protein n=1 Tax=Plutella xylostella TaxID=51655 RepID=A0A8S4E642_PLUXY|nr:unnamed protein product [Plutella xylostella]